MSTKIEYEDGSVYFEPEPSETENLEYVYLLCDDYENGGHYPYRFFNRMCNGLIKAPFSKLQFMNNDEIVSTLEGTNWMRRNFGWRCSLSMIGPRISLSNASI